MKTLSIKKFSLLILAFIVPTVSLLFFDFYLKQREITQELIKTNLQSAALSLNHFLRKNFDPNEIGNIVSQLDSRIITNKAISSIKIVDENNHIIYTSQQLEKSLAKDDKCQPITNIMKSNLSKVSCYDFSIKHYQGLQAHFYRVIIGLNKEYIAQLQTQEAKRMLGISLLFTLFFFILIYFLLERFMIKPLEGLRTYAYYSEYSPQKFLIKEFESIRYSLEMTFKRLRTEQENLYNLSTKDPLTGLYNRNDLKSQVQRIIASAKRNNNHFAIIFLDLDNFKNINDSVGHHFGDIILTKVATVLRTAIRENDVPARIGGDEFLIVLPEIENERSVIEVVQRIKEQLSKPIIMENERYNVTVSMGVALYPKDGEDFNTLLKNADIAMYEAKELGKNNYQFFTNKLNKSVQEKIKMQSLLSDALQNNYFQLFYQPKVDIDTQTIVGCEALIRLVDPYEGVISPDRFIPLAEETGMIIPLGEWIIKEACEQIQKWQDTPLKNIKLSINVSGLQLEDRNFFEMLQSNIACIESAKLDIELTESVLIQDFNDKITLLHKIKDLGVTLSLDDFGTGYSSLSYLRDIPFDTLKIDKSFIDSMEENKIFINMIIGIAEDLHLNVVAEGVETQAQLEYLKDMKCEMYQGYLCSKPLPAKEFETLFQSCSNNS
jgi:diguanylate cyclase (GGDEF)-like protein